MNAYLKALELSVNKENIKRLRHVMRDYKESQSSVYHELVCKALIDIASRCSEEEIESALIQENLWDVILNAIIDNH